MRRGTPFAAISHAIDRQFLISESGSTIRTEVVAGMTTFLTMAYIIVVNPTILAQAGVPFSGALFATCVASAVGSLLMALIANYPFALAPGMGINAYFTFTVVLSMNYDWRVALGAVFISGAVFTLLTLVRIRALIVDAIPVSLKTAVGAGIGFFIAFIGLKNAGVIAASPTTFVTIGQVISSSVALALLGLLVIAVLMARRIRAAMIIGITVVTLLAMAIGVAQRPSGFLAKPDWHSTLGALDIRGALHLGLLDVVFVFLFVDMFDSIGSLVGLGRHAGLLDSDGRLPRLNRALFSDAIASMVGAVLGTSTVVTYIESATGVSEGGRTGFTAVIVSLFFLLAAFFSPILGSVPVIATAPALIIVGVLMTRSVLSIKWDDLTEALPAFLTIIAMPLTFSIANGLAFGFIFYPAMKVLTGRAREVKPLVYVLAVLFILRYAYLQE